ncbi:MAG TPA: 50S ribosomal protein L18 [Thermoanaerobaculia bacterium]|nr:50S ribosomal protein L18 [Thermoanaerobaculia bacterium]
MSEGNVHKKRVMEKRERRHRAHQRIRTRVRGTAERPRLAVFKSLLHIYAQIIDDDRGTTLVAASTLDAEVKAKLAGNTGNREAARAVGEVVALRAKAKGIEQVVFDRGGYVYHGKVKEIAESARKQGLDF